MTHMPGCVSDFEDARTIRQVIIGDGPWPSLGAAVAAESVVRKSWGVDRRWADLDGPIWPAPNSIYWALAPENRPPNPDERETMNARTESSPALDQATFKPTLMTGWASSLMLGNFDQEQFEVNRWAEATDEERNETLIAHMTVADAEELIETASNAAREHERRASRAMQLASRIAERLGRAAEADRASSPTTIAPGHAATTGATR